MQIDKISGSALYTAPFKLSTKSFPSNWLPYLLIALVWLVTRAFPFYTIEPWVYWEVGEAKKLLEYGFLERGGAIIDNHFMTGLVAEPWKFNYVNHPYPILWFDTLVYRLAGGWGVVVANGLIGLGACLLVFPALRSLCSPQLALLGAFIFTVAPSAILFTFDTNIVQLGAILWPPAIFLIGKGLKQARAATAVALGVIVFLAGQIAWFSYSVLPALLLAAGAVAYERSRGFTTKPNSALIIAIVAGGVLTLAVFIGQIIHYTYDFAETFAYVRGQAGAEHGVPVGQMYVAIALRGILSVGPALLLGAVAGFVCLLRTKSVNWLQWSALLYPLLFLGAVIALPRFFFRERTMYQYLLFPCTVLTVTALQHARGRWATTATVGLAVVALAYPMFQASIPKASVTSKELGGLIRAITKPEEIVVTNLAGQQSPFQSWDVGSIDMASLAADRMLRGKITTTEALQALLKNYRSHDLNIVYFYDSRRPIGKPLLAFLRSAAEPVIVPFAAPDEPASAATRLRNLYWRLAGKHQVTGEGERQGSAEQFEVFRFRLSESAQPVEKGAPL